jgi:hypothetical protein
MELAMHIEWMAVEHHRIHLMEQWPDGHRKDAGLAAARSALASLARILPAGSSFACATCISRQQTVVMIPSAPRVQSLPSTLAA